MSAGETERPSPLQPQTAEKTYFGNTFDGFSQQGTAWALYEGDGTSLGASARIVAVTTDQRTAKRWEKSLPKDSWEYRAAYEMRLIAVEGK